MQIHFCTLASRFGSWHRKDGSIAANEQNANNIIKPPLAVVGKDCDGCEEVAIGDMISPPGAENNVVSLLASAVVRDTIWLLSSLWTMAQWSQDDVDSRRCPEWALMVAGGFGFEVASDAAGQVTER